MARKIASHAKPVRRTPGKIHEDQFRLMWAEGAAIWDIAEFFGVRTPAVYNARKRFGLRADRKERQPPASPPSPSADSIAATQAQQQWHRHRAGAA